jgi:hypothetical protein
VGQPKIFLLITTSDTVQDAVVMMTGTFTFVNSAQRSIAYAAVQNQRGVPIVRQAGDMPIE